MLQAWKRETTQNEYHYYRGLINKIANEKIAFSTSELLDVPIYLFAEERQCSFLPVAAFKSFPAVRRMKEGIYY